eukprot:UC4_evm1s1438
MLISSGSKLKYPTKNDDDEQLRTLRSKIEVIKLNHNAEVSELHAAIAVERKNNNTQTDSGRILHEYMDETLALKNEHEKTVSSLKAQNKNFKDRIEKLEIDLTESQREIELCKKNAKTTECTLNEKNLELKAEVKTYQEDASDLQKSLHRMKEELARAISARDEALLAAESIKQNIQDEREETREAKVIQDAILQEAEENMSLIKKENETLVKELRIKQHEMAGLERMRREAKMSEMQLREQIKYFDISIKEQNFRSRPPPRKAEWNVDFTDKKIMMSTPSKDNLDTRVQFESVTPIPHPPRRRIRSSPSKGSQ